MHIVPTVGKSTLSLVLVYPAWHGRLRGAAWACGPQHASLDASRLVLPKRRFPLRRNKHVVNVLHQTFRRTRSGRMAHLGFPTGWSVTLITRQAQQ